MQDYFPEPHEVEARKSALFELAYLVLVAYLYIGAFFAPLFGGVIGLYVSLGATHPATKRVGKITMICAAIGFVLVLALVVLWLFLFGALAAIGSS